MSSPESNANRRGHRRRERSHRHRSINEESANNVSVEVINENLGVVVDGGHHRHPHHRARQPRPYHSLDASANGDEYTADVSTTAESATTGDTSSAASLADLQALCDSASSFRPSSWDAIRQWLRRHSAADARLAATQRGDYDTTPLHLACRNCPPVDVVRMLVRAAPQTVRWADSFGWLPLHYACANEAGEEVLVLLAEEFPDSKTWADKRKRTPLHFALGHTERPAGEDAVRLLSGTGAALFPDENGMLPLHYACAYGATEEALKALTDDRVDTIAAPDSKGRTPLHFALGNADRPASPNVVRLLLSRNPAVVNCIDAEGNLPIHLLATRAQAIREHEKDKCHNCQECLGLYLDADPRPTADLLMALQALPQWLRDLAVLSPMVQKMLNLKISQRVPTFITLLDVTFYVLVIVFFQLAVTQSLDDRFYDDVTPGLYSQNQKAGADSLAADTNNMNKALLAPLFLAAFWFTLREIFQALSLASLGLFHTWLSDMTNWFDVVYIFLILFWSGGMLTQAFNNDFFRKGCALSLGVFWMNILLFLKSMMVGFAVFVGGVVYVVKRLAAFLFTLIIILVAFSQMFYTVFRQSDQCRETDDYVVLPGESTACQCIGGYYNALGECVEGENVCIQPAPEICEPINDYPWCNFWTSLFKVYTMLLGEVAETDFAGSQIAMVLFAAFMFGVVILLANVLIAIVTDSYSVIKNERAALVFWSNRLDFVAEMDVISNSFSRFHQKEDAAATIDEEDTFGRELWKKFMYLFEEEAGSDDHGVISIEFIVYSLLRFFTAVFIIPLWIILGAVTCGVMWPPQVREKLLTGRLTRRSVKEVENRMNQVTQLRTDLSLLHAEIVMDIDRGRDEIVDIKNRLDGAKTEIHLEMNNIKEIVTELFETVMAG